MALTRKFLSALGIEQDKIDEIIESHAETVNGLKNKIAIYKEDSDKLEKVEKELNDLKDSVAKNGEDPYKSKYEDTLKEFNDFKEQVNNAKVTASKTDAYRKLLEDAGVSTKRIDSVLRVTDLEKLELTDDGKLKDSDKLTESIKTEWSDFIVATETKGANTSTPPTNAGGGSTMTLEDFYKIKDRGERVKVLAEHPELFNKGE